jgi:hypothetical protein
MRASNQDGSEIGKDENDARTDRFRLGICPPKCQRKLDELSSFVLLEIGR